MPVSEIAEDEEQLRELIAASVTENSWMMKTWADLICIYEMFS